MKELWLFIILKLCVLQLGSVILVMSGIILFAYADGLQPTNVVGVVLSVGAAIGAAVYKACNIVQCSSVEFTNTSLSQVLLKWRVGGATFYQMTLFLSSLGVFSTLFLWPIPLALHLLEVEKVENVPWGLMCASSALSVIFNFSINFGIAYTFPLFISIGTLLGIPLNAVIDQVFRNVSYLNWKFPATDFLIGGFMLMLLPPSDSQSIQKQLWRQTIGRIDQ